MCIYFVSLNVQTGARHIISVNERKQTNSDHMFETFYNFLDNFVTLLNNIWFRMNKTLSVLTLLGQSVSDYWQNSQNYLYVYSIESVPKVISKNSLHLALKL